MSDRRITTGNADVVDRLARLRAVLPLLAGDLAVARRHARALELENRRLSRRVAELESRLERGRARPAPAAATASRVSRAR
jgi:hypothetical protein